MTDPDTSVDQLRQMVRRFVESRDWRQFHSPKNLSMSLAIEAAELMEHFQWITCDASRRVGQEHGKLAQVSDELADVLCYALAMSNELDIDITTAVCAKLKKNERKYPADQYRGRYGPEDTGGAGS